MAKSDIFALFIVGITLIGIFFSTTYFSRTKEVVITDSGIEFVGAFGTEVLWDEVSSIDLLESIPEIGLKVNGAGIGTMKTGSYVLDGYGTVLLYIDSEVSKYIKIEYNDNYVFFNSNSVSDTSHYFTLLTESFVNASNGIIT